MYIDDFELKGEVVEIFHYCPREVLFNIIDTQNKNITLLSKKKISLKMIPPNVNGFGIILNQKQKI